LLSFLPFHPERALDAVGGQVDQIPAEDAVVGLGAGVDAERVADPPFPPDSWMWPWTPRTGRNDSIALWTPVDPTGPRSTSPAEAVGWRVGERSGAVSRPEL
jgi:hypothetical protein